MRVREPHDGCPSICNYTSKVSLSLLRLSKQRPCICDRETFHQDDGRLAGWGSISEGLKTDRKGINVAKKAPRKAFPSRLYETASPGNEYVFKHYEDASRYMEQYRRDHTVMGAGRTMLQPAPEDIVVTPETSTSSGRLRLPSVRGDGCALLATTVSIKDQSEVDRGQTLEDAKRASSQERFGRQSVSPQSNLSTSRSGQHAKAKRNKKRGRRKLGHVDVGDAKPKTADSYTGGTFVNVVGQLRAEIVGSKVGIDRNNTRAESLQLRADGNGWPSLDNTTLRSSSIGDAAPSGDGGVNDLKQPLYHLRHGDVIPRPARTYDTWESLWRDDFQQFTGSTSIKGTFNMEGALDDRSLHRQVGKLHHMTVNLNVGKGTTATQNFFKAGQKDGTVTPSNYFGAQSLFYTRSGICNNHRLPIGIGHPRKAPPLSRNTVVVGSPIKTEEPHGL